METPVAKVKKMVATAAAVGGVLALGAGVGMAVADHFNQQNVPPGWTYTVNAGQTICYRGCSDVQVPCDSKGQPSLSKVVTGGSITYHPKGDGGINNPHVFTVQLEGSTPKTLSNGQVCQNTK
jgi:uncharacterized membrane protein